MSFASGLTASFLEQNRSQWVKVTSTVLPSVAAFCFALRVYTKVKIVKQVAATDAVLLAALVCVLLYRRVYAPRGCFANSGYSDNQCYTHDDLLARCDIRCAFCRCSITNTGTACKDGLGQHVEVVPPSDYRPIIRVFLTDEFLIMVNVC